MYMYSSVFCSLVYPPLLMPYCNAPPCIPLTNAPLYASLPAPYPAHTLPAPFSSSHTPLYLFDIPPIMNTIDISTAPWWGWCSTTLVGATMLL